MTVIIEQEYYTLYMIANHQLLGAEMTLFHWHQTAEASLSCTHIISIDLLSTGLCQWFR